MERLLRVSLHTNHTLGVVIYARAPALWARAPPRR